MKSLQEILESNQNSIPWSDNSAILYTLYLISEATRGEGNKGKKCIETTLELLSNQQRDQVLKLIEHISKEKCEYITDVFTILTNGIKLDSQTKGIKISSWSE